MIIKSGLTTEYFNLDLEVKTVDTLTHSRVSAVQSEVQEAIDKGKVYMLGLLKSVEKEHKEKLERVGK